MLPYSGLPPSTLTNAEVDAFVRDGYLAVPGLIPSAVVAAVQPQIIAALGDTPAHPERWDHGNGYLLKDSPRAAQVGQRFTDRYRGILADLCGPGRFVMPDDFLGYMPIRFPQPTAPAWRPAVMHVDGNHFHHHVDSREQGLIAVELWSDIAPEGGGTAIRVGSHRVVSRLLASHEPAGIASAALSLAAIASAAHLPVIEAIGAAGSVLFMHPHTLHGSSTNRSDRVRLAGNLCISLHEPMRLDRGDLQQCSPVEWSIVHSMGGASAP
ncbi:MAG: phytanoyl-CoA dioxygenase family protein [Planctomycetes bacterium]|nr:phytanoyl-CoA dioxygenase family protein [Planctomycetota bacterium]